MAVSNMLTSLFEVVKRMIYHDTAEVVAINIWNEKTLFQIHVVYGTLNIKNLNLDPLTLNINTIIVGDFMLLLPIGVTPTKTR